MPKNSNIDHNIHRLDQKKLHNSTFTSFLVVVFVVGLDFGCLPGDVTVKTVAQRLLMGSTVETQLSRGPSGS